MGLGMFTILFVILLLVTLVVLSKDLLRAAVALALASVALSSVLFLNGAWMAAFFELSVCAGLITVLFVSTLSLTKDSDQAKESKLSGNPFFFSAILLLLLAVDAFAMRWIAQHVSVVVPSGLPEMKFGDTFWNTRTTDIIGQVALLLAGVFAILALFKRAPQGRKHE
jgi:NADH-quinone oxidoreductase subunit J